MDGDFDDIAPGITSLSEALRLSVALLDGDELGPLQARAGSALTNGDAPRQPRTDELARTPTERSIGILLRMQTDISRGGLYASDNESLDDVATPTLELLSVEYHLARAYLQLPTHQAPPGATNVPSGETFSPARLRRQNVTRATECFHSFLGRVERLGDGVMGEATVKEYHSMLDGEEEEDADGGGGKRSSAKMNPAQLRDLKIRRFQRKKAAKQATAHLNSLLDRRSRLGLAPDEAMEGHDYDSLRRTLAVETLRVHAETALEELQSSAGEMEMLEMAMRMEGTSRGGSGGEGHDARTARGGGMPLPQDMAPRMPQIPLQMTQVTLNPATNQLEYTKATVSNGRLVPTQTIRREEVGKTVFRPGWNQPTMSLAELGEREMAEAIARGESQKLAEEEAMLRPRRYEQLEKDGMEDDEGLVEASAELDRKWDDWKEENPRGSGNKMKERGDRNF